ncbi:hypothetical protein SAMN05192555_101145 [Franzmannia pantelleriensis]|uniref:Adhesin n=1 Tax=Franzmannia pantelleriensis TaxID=48727 RepID=A0A1G9EKU4_9GAMM|nr:hypothetical protein [Halomonas pantelleriensis]SDK76671.1 hypothetical protein SAMN05192555_101145 [Halomonas pantelleriensis]
MKTFNKAPLAMAVALSAMLGSSAALAFNWPPAPQEPEGNSFETNSSIDSTVDNDIDVSLSYDADYRLDVDVKGTVRTYDRYYTGAVIDSKQLNDNNEVNNTKTNNDAAIGDNVLRDAQGNIGANVAAGDNNQQANDAALASSDAKMVFAKADNYSFQSSSNNNTNNIGTQNDASMGGNSLANASGNIGVNVAAGVGNTQQNSFAAAVGKNGSSNATTGGVQASYNNVTDNDLYAVAPTCGFYGCVGGFVQVTNNDASMSGNTLQGASGNIGANVAAGTGNMQRNTLSVAHSSRPASK